MSNQDIQEQLGVYTKSIDERLEQVFTELPPYDHYKHLAYFMGFADRDLVPNKTYAGKRIRPCMTLMLADMYGVRAEALPVAIAIELFHNFTLIHDDIVDQDEMRRGRPTVWKQFGTDYAINDGDAQAFLSIQQLTDPAIGSAETRIAVQDYLTKQFLKVVEGQHLDFTLTDLSITDVYVTEARYTEMIGRKTSDLVASSAKVAGIVAGVPEAELQALHTYGYNLGLAYQVLDDLVSVWGKEEHTGKRPFGDIVERKKTLPIIWGYNALEESDKKRFTDMYTKDTPITETEAREIADMLKQAGAYDYTRTVLQRYADDARNAVEQLSCETTEKETLCGIVDFLLSGQDNV